MAYFENDDVLHLAISDEPEAGSVEVSPSIVFRPKCLISWKPRWRDKTSVHGTFHPCLDVPARRQVSPISTFQFQAVNGYIAFLLPTFFMCGI